MNDIDSKKIKQIISLFEKSKLAKMDLEIEDIKISMEKPKEEINYIASLDRKKTLSSALATEKMIEGEAITSPLVGTFYAAIGKEKKPFVEVGSNVKKGDVLCIIEAMKVMNEIKAGKDGKISSIEIKDGETVQFDDVLMYII